MSRRTLLPVAIAMATLVSACPGTLEGGPCMRAEDCTGSQVCLDGVCRALSSLPDGAIAHLDASRAADAAEPTIDASRTDDDAAMIATDAGLDASSERADASVLLDAAVTDAAAIADAEIPCRTSADCPSVAAGELFCETGTSCGEGVCRTRPARCEDAGTSGDSTVCGCDGRRYASDCWRQFFGVGVGEGCTETTPIRCRSEHAGSCAPGSFCELSVATARPCEAGDGTCVEIPLPASCDPTPSLVCGCDGRTYTSACERRAAATSARGTGFCACARSADCPAPDTFCDRGLAHAAAECASADPGVCARVPASCPGGDAAGDEVAECGTGVVHEDDCLRRSARVERAVGPPECSGGSMPAAGCCFDTTDCIPGQYCYGPATCGVPGVCLAVPARRDDCYADSDCLPGHACEGETVDACGSPRAPTPGRCVLRADAVFGS